MCTLLKGSYDKTHLTTRITTVESMSEKKTATVTGAQISKINVSLTSEFCLSNTSLRNGSS